MEQLLDKYKKDFVLFLEAGFIAVNQMDESAATRLFHAAEILKPDNVLPKVGEGYLQLHLLNLKKAQSCFEEVLRKEPDNEMAKTFLGIVLSWIPQETIKGEKLLVETQKSSDKAIKKLATSALEFVDEFVKKEPSPAEMKKVQKKKK